MSLKKKMLDFLGIAVYPFDLPKGWENDVREAIGEVADKIRKKSWVQKVPIEDNTGIVDYENVRVVSLKDVLALLVSFGEEDSK